MTKPKVYRHNGRSMDFLFSMTLFLVFLLCSVFTILIGSKVYSNIRERNDAAFYSDTALSYIANKVRQSDRSDSISVKKIEEEEVLVLRSEADSLFYETYIYTKDGTLFELFSEENSGLPLEAGTPVMECADIAFYLSESTDAPLLTITLTEKDGSKRDALLSLRSRKGGPDA